MHGPETNGIGTERARRARRQDAARQSVGKLFDKQPPQSPEAEMALLGSIILDPKVTGDVLHLVTSGRAFYAEAHSAIFDALLAAYDRHEAGDLVQLADALKDAGVLDQIGGVEYLVQLAESVPSAVNAPYYAKIVADKAKLRDLIDAASQILYDAYHAGELGPDGAREVLDVAEQQIFEIAQSSDSTDPQRLSELLHEAMELLEANQGVGVTGVGTGFHELDQMLSGFQRGEMIIIAARPSMGKTALALNLAEGIAMQGDNGKPCPVAVFSMEMSKQSVTQRLIAARSGVDSHRLRTGQLHEEHYRQIVRACGELAEAPIYIDDTPAMTILQMRSRARRLVAQHGVKCVMIDYLQLMSSPGAARESRQVEVSTISRGVKALARELNIPVVCLAQLNRGAEQREGHRPRMSDLRESGSIEQDADVIMLLHREAYYHMNDPAWFEENEGKENLAELIIAKQRNGPTGVARLEWDSATTRFRNPTGGYDEGYSPSPPPEYRNGAGSGKGASQFTNQSAIEAKPGPRGGMAGYIPASADEGPAGDERNGGGPDVDPWDDAGDLPI